MSMEVLLTLVYFAGWLLCYTTELLKIYMEPIVKSHRVAVGRARFLSIVVICIPPLLLPFIAQPRMAGAFGPASIAIGMVLMGIAIYIWTMYFLDYQRIMEAIGGFHQTESRYLITTGLYGKVRHPIYTGCFFTALGWCFIWRAVHGLLFMPVILVNIFIQIFIEEKYLGKEFGDEYARYRRRVPMLFPPYFVAVLAIVAAVLAISTVFGWMRIT